MSTLSSALPVGTQPIPIFLWNKINKCEIGLVVLSRCPELLAVFHNRDVLLFPEFGELRFCRVRRSLAEQ